MSIKLAKLNMRKRKEAEKLVYDVMDKLDPSGANTKKYRDIFSKMSDNEFQKFMSEMWLDDTKNFVVDIVDFERDLDITKVENAAKVLKVPLEEYVMLPYANMNLDNPVVTRTPVLVMYIIFKRPQQTTQKKNSTSIHVDDRSSVTGQVVGDDKNGRSSDIENAALLTKGAVNVAREMNGFRADGLQRKNMAYASIATNGFVSLEEVEASAGISDRLVLNTVDTMFLGMSLKTDLVDEGMLLTKSARDIKKKD